MDDKDSSNMARVGHRRWLLNPGVTSMGIGSAKSDSGWWITDVRVFDNTNSSYYDSSYGSTGTSTGTRAGTDYDFIAWPASGAMLSELFSVGTPWSVTLNPSRYSVPSVSSVKVTVTRQSDGRSWTLDSSDNAVTTTGEYFNVDTGSYGVANCIVFNPGSANLGADAYEGTYHVEVTGLKTKSGDSTSLSYDVSFASARTDLSEATVSVSDATYTGNYLRPTVRVTCGGSVLTQGTDYSVAYSDNLNPGTATVRVTAAGDSRRWKGSTKATFQIRQARQSGSGSNATSGSSGSSSAGQSSSGGSGSSGTSSSGGSGGSSAAPSDASNVPMYRVYNRWTGEHLFTADAEEYELLAQIGWSQEGIAWESPAEGDAVWRLYNPYSGDHFYTQDWSEYERLGSIGWNQEGVSFRSGGDLPIYRLFNPWLTAGTHLFTSDSAEYTDLAAIGWVGEGVAFSGTS